MNKQYKAHSGADGKEPQSYEEHLTNVRSRALCYFDKTFQHYPNNDIKSQLRWMLEAFCEFHDFGKLMPNCQLILNSTTTTEQKMDNHVDAGVAYCILQFHKTKNMGWLYVAWMILAHHIGFHDWEDLVRVLTRKGFLSTNQIELGCKWRDEKLKDYVDSIMPELIQAHNESIQWSDRCKEQTITTFNWFDVLMTFSCGVNADHNDTAFYYNNWELPTARPLLPEQRKVGVQEYAEELSKGKTDKRTENRLLLFDAAKQPTKTNWVKNDGPVGTGKTNANNYLALNIAEQHKCDKIIGIAPFCNVLHQTVGKSKLSMLLPGEFEVGVINELHSKVEFTKPWLYKYNNRWDAPITFTTAVQFFESLASYHPVGVSKIHHFANSVITLDEYHQAMPYELWCHALTLLQQLVERFNVHVVYSSGTPVNLWDIYHKNITVGNMLTDKEYKVLAKAEKKRVKCNHIEEVSLTKLCKLITREHNISTLVVCNTTHNAQLLYDLLKPNHKGDIFYYSNRLTPFTRNNVLSVIMDRLEKKLPVMVIATSGVECGIDFSFEKGYREEGSFLSFQQFNGRINRNNEYPCGYVTLFRFNEFLRKNKVITINPTISKEIRVFQTYTKKNWTPEHSTVAVRDSITERDWQLIDKINDNYSRGNIKSVAYDFRLIKTVNITIVVNKDIISKIKNGQDVPYGEITKHSVSVFENNYKKLRDSGMLEALDDGESTIYALNDPDSQYDEEVGIGKALREVM